MAKEKRLIDANRLKAEFPYMGRFGKDLWDVTAIWKAIANAPTVDAVEVVYCKDCARRKNGFCTIRKDSWGATLRVGEHDFCSDAEKMDGDGNA